METRLQWKVDSATIDPPEGATTSYWHANFFAIEGRWVVLRAEFKNTHNQWIAKDFDVAVSTGASRDLAIYYFHPNIIGRPFRVIYF